MLLEFETKRNTNGNKKYLAIDTEAKTFSRNCRSYMSFGIVIGVMDMKSLIEKLNRNEYKEVQYVW